MARPKISVALCTYNGAQFLLDQLESIAAQTRLPDELVVCDDGSNDDTVGILRAFANRVPFIRLEINTHNLGSTKNFEKTIGLCEGEIIALSDQDDVWKPQKLAVLEKALDENPDGGYAFSDAELIDEKSELLGRTLWESIGFVGSARTSFSSNGQVARLLRRATVTGATMVFRSDLKKILLPFSTYFAQDYWISLLASSVGSYGIPIPDRLVYYRQHDAQLIGVPRGSFFERVKRVRQRSPMAYGQTTQWYVDMRDRLLLARSHGSVIRANHIKLLEGKIAHCSSRASARTAQGAVRLNSILSEVLTGRYSRYSNSWASVLEDLCF